MAMNELIGRPYDRRTWNCWSLVKHVHDIGDIDVISTSFSKNAATAKALYKKHVVENTRFDVIDVKEIRDNDIVIMGRHHVGIFYQGSVIHVTRKDGTKSEKLAIILKLFNTKILRPHK